MKKYCKNVDITDRNLISVAAYKCLDGKYKRNDTLRLLSKESGLTENQIYCILHRYGCRAVRCIVESVITTIQNEIIRCDLQLIPIWYKPRKDASSGKLRRIGIQDVKQQIYDYIAVEALRPIFCRIGVHQYASIKGRGPLKGGKTDPALVEK